MKNPVLRGLVLIGILLLIFAFHTLEQGNLLLQKIKDKLTAYETKYGPEKTYLQTDKDCYSLGDTLWFKTYLVDGISHRKSGKSHVAYVELLNAKDSIVARRKLFVEGTSAASDIVIDAFMPQGAYRLRAFTNYMLNDRKTPLFEKWVTVGSKRYSDKTLEDDSHQEIATTRSDSLFSTEDMDDGIRLRFFPEGGHLVDGLPSVLGIEAVDSSGKGLPLKGKIHTADGTVVQQFESSEFGLGKVNFAPKPNESYYATVQHNGGGNRFEMPTSLKSGYGLNVRNRDHDIIVQVSTTAGHTLDGTLLVGHLRGDMILERIGKTNDGGNYAVRLLSDRLPDGVASFTLFTPNGEPVCERLIFNDRPGNAVRVSMNTETTIFAPRAKVDLDIALNDGNGIPIQGDFSLSVTLVDNRAEARPFALKSWLLLDSDLEGTVTNPDFFFKDRSKQTRSLLDALMLTKGWRRFVWKDLIGKKANVSLAYEPEKGIRITGIMTDSKKKSYVKNALITLNTLDRSFEDQQRTDSEARFQFGPYVFNDTLEAVLQAVNPNPNSQTGNAKRTIELNPTWPSVSVKRKSGYYGELWDNNTMPGKSDGLSYGQTREFSPSAQVNRLKGVTVKSKKKTIARRINEIIDRTTAYGSPNLRIFKDSVPGSQTLSVLELIARMGGSFGRSPTSVSFSAPPVVLVDGTYTRLEAIRDMRANEVKFIDILKPYNTGTAIYGSRGAGGVIAIYTQYPSEVGLVRQKPVSGITVTKIPGFYKAREFYSPDYTRKTPVDINSGQDGRTTLLWEPRLIRQKDGSSRLQFYTSDRTGRYNVRLEGITDNGKLVQANYEFKVEP